MRYFHVSREAALLPLTLYTLGLALGPVLAAPISETFGRRIVYLSTLPISLLFTLGAGASQNFGSFLVCRFFAGAIGGPCLAVGAGTNVELFRPLNRAAATSLFLLSPFLGPAFGPTVGGFAAENKGWRWTQWPILFIGAVAWFYSLFQSETYKKIILQKRAKRLGIAPPKQAGPTGLAKVKLLVTVTLIRPVYMLFAEPIVGFFSLYTGFNFSVLFCFFAAFPFVFQGVYKFDSGETGLTFLGIAIGCVCAVVIFVSVDRVTYRKRLLQSRQEGKGDIIAPEYRLYPAMIGSILLPVGLFIFAWSARKSVHWIVPVLASIPFACGNLLVFVSLHTCSCKIFRLI
jgi:MFS family permease